MIFALSCMAEISLGLWYTPQTGGVIHEGGVGTINT